MNKFLTFFFLLFSFPVFAQTGSTDLPTLPEPIKNLVAEGAQIRFLGREHGFDSWLTIKNGQEQYFYVLPDQSAFVMGVLFDNQGKLLTLRQVQKLREKGDPTLDALADENFAGLSKNSVDSDSYEFKTPAERLFADVQESNWVALGRAGAPIAYAFIDPQCPHCHAFTEEIKADLDAGRIQLRLVPIGFKDETRAQAAFLIAAPNAQERWYKHLAGDETALPAKAEINQQGVQRNLAIMQSWKFNVTPMIIYRGKDGSVKLIRGKPTDQQNFINDLSHTQQ